MAFSAVLIFVYGPPETVARYTLYPTTSVEVLAAHERSTLCCGGAVPLPVKDSLVGEFEALLAKEMFAEAVPLDCGVNVTVTDVVCPAVIVNGNDTPLSLNSDELAEADDTVTFDPVAVKVAVNWLLWPTTTLPKFKVVGLTPNWPGTVPVPDNEMVRVELEASEVNEIVPLVAPAAAGAKVAPKVKLCPAIRVRGRLSPLMLNPLPLTLACDTVIVVPPVFVKVSVCDVLLLT